MEGCLIMDLLNYESDIMLMQHPVGRSINLDWFVNSIIMVVYENFFSVQSEFCVQRMNRKIFSHRQPL